MDIEREQLLEKLLSDNLARTIGWVTYAEAKNLALLTFCSGWMVALFVFATNDDATLSLPRVGSWAALLPFVAAALISLHSFLPQLSPSHVEGRAADPDEPNLLFFGHLAGIDSGQAGPTFKARYLADGGGVSEAFIADIGSQTVINSIIAARKFHSFKIASVFVVAAVTVLIVFALISIVRRTGLLGG